MGREASARRPLRGESGRTAFLESRRRKVGGILSVGRHGVEFSAPVRNFAHFGPLDGSAETVQWPFQHCEAGSAAFSPCGMVFAYYYGCRAGSTQYYLAMPCGAFPHVSIGGRMSPRSATFFCAHRGLAHFLRSLQDQEGVLLGPGTRLAVMWDVAHRLGCAVRWRLLGEPSARRRARQPQSRCE